MTCCSEKLWSACFVFRNFHNSASDMENICCWILKRGSPGWTPEDEARCTGCAYYIAINRHGITVKHAAADTVIIECSGTLNMLRTEALGEIADKLKSQKKNRIILDLSAVMNIYSCAMSMILRMHLQCEETGGKFVMAGATGYVKVALDTVSIAKLVNCAETTDEAFEIMGEVENAE
jgi:anti-sigma B factor antagonist